MTIPKVEKQKLYPDNLDNLIQYIKLKKRGCLGNLFFLY